MQTVETAEVTNNSIPSSMANYIDISELLEKLEAAEIIAKKGHLITTEELSLFLGIKSAAVTSKGNRFSWRNWIVTRVRREGAQILWQLEDIV